MAEKKFKGAPFGRQSARFDVSGAHPANKKVGGYTQIPYCKKMTSDMERRRGPGTYDIDRRSEFSPQSLAKRAKGPGWHRALEVSREAQRPHLLYRDAWAHKQFLKTKVGPGTYENKDLMQELTNKPGSARGVCDGLERRFKEVKSCTPGPGSYGRGGVPWAALEEKRAESAGCLQMDLCGPVKRFSENTQDGGPSPCSYNLKSSVDLLLDRTVSKRGPYDLFTGQRDRPIMSGHSAVQKRTGPIPGQYKVMSFGDELRRREKRKHGVFSSLDQYPSTPTERIFHSTLAQRPRPATSPAPGAHEVRVSAARPGSHNPPPFLSSVPRQTKQQERQQNGNYNVIGPGRYNMDTKEERSPGGPTSPFKSQTQRCLSLPHQDRHMQERLRAVNVPLDRRSFLVSR